MAFSNNNRANGRFKGPTREMKCSCGGAAKLKNKMVYSFGKKSKGKKISFYKCQSCGKRYN